MFGLEPSKTPSWPEMRLRIIKKLRLYDGKNGELGCLQVGVEKKNGLTAYSLAEHIDETQNVMTAIHGEDESSSFFIVQMRPLPFELFNGLITLNLLNEVLDERGVLWLQGIEAYPLNATCDGLDYSIYERQKVLEKKPSNAAFSSNTFFEETIRSPTTMVSFEPVKKLSQSERKKAAKTAAKGVEGI